MEETTSQKNLPAGRSSRLPAGGATLVIVIGVVLAAYLLTTAPETVPEPESKPVKTIETRLVSPGTHALRVLGYGKVIPAQEVTLSSEVGGRIVRQNASLVPGGYLSAGEEILGIDEADYKIALSEQKAALEETESELQLESGRQVVAAREWEQLRKEMPEIEVNRDLVLRTPHLRKIEAAIDRARSLIAKAELDLQRTSLVAPFNAFVLEESVETGQLVHIGDVVATLVGADEFWVQTSVRQNELPRIALPAEGKRGAPARIILETGEDGVIYRGEVVRVLSDLEPNGRNARVIVSVSDPLGLRSPRGSEAPELPLLLRSFVRVEIEAGVLSNALSLDLSLLREGDEIWVMDQHQTLQIRQTEVLWRQGERVYLSNTLEPGDAVVVSKLRALVPGTEVVSKRQTPEDASE